MSTESERLAQVADIASAFVAEASIEDGAYYLGGDDDVSWDDALDPTEDGVGPGEQIVRYFVSWCSYANELAGHLTNNVIATVEESLEEGATTYVVFSAYPLDEEPGADGVVVPGILCRFRPASYFGKGGLHAIVSTLAMNLLLLNEGS
jgi:hypothetical protein